MKFVLYAICVLFAHAVAAQVIYPTDTLVVAGGNKIVLGGYVDTAVSVDPITGEQKYIIDYNGYKSPKHPGQLILNRVPVKLNDHTVYSPNGSVEVVDCARMERGKMYITEYLQKKTRRQYRKLHEAGYNADIRNLLVSPEGKVVYYEYTGLYKTDATNKKQLPAAYLQRTDRKAKKILESMQLKPGMVNNKLIPYRINHYELL